MATFRRGIQLLSDRRDRDRLHVFIPLRRGWAGFLLFVPLLIAAAVILESYALSNEWNAWAGLVLAVFGGALFFGHRTITLDRRVGTLVTTYGAPLTFRSTTVPLGRVDTVSIAVVRRVIGDSQGGGNTGFTTFEVNLKRSSNPDAVVAVEESWEAAMALANGCARFLGAALQDTARASFVRPDELKAYSESALPASENRVAVRVMASPARPLFIYSGLGLVLLLAAWLAPGGGLAVIAAVLGGACVLAALGSGVASLLLRIGGNVVLLLRGRGPFGTNP